jgi:hypothetical protein
MTSACIISLSAAAAWSLVGALISYRVEPKVTKIALLVLTGIVLWPLTAWLGRVKRRNAKRFQDRVEMLIAQHRAEQGNVEFLDETDVDE